MDHGKSSFSHVKLVSRLYQIHLHRRGCAHASLRQAQRGRKLYHARKLQRSSLTVHKFRAASKELLLRMGVCETLMPAVVAPEAHQNSPSCVRELSGPILSI